MALTPPAPEEIRAFRLKHGLSQAELGEKLGGSVRAVQDWEAVRGGAPVRTPPAMLRLALAAIEAGLAPLGAGHVTMPPRTYFARVTAEGPDDYVVRFKDVPQALTGGSTEAEALRRAPDALSMVLERYLTEGRPWPPERPPAPGEHPVQVSADVIALALRTRPGREG